MPPNASTAAARPDLDSPSSIGSAGPWSPAPRHSARRRGAVPQARWPAATHESRFAGGSPTKGFLGSVDTGPFAGAFHAIAGAWWADWLFMLGLLGIGVAVTLGVALRISAVVGSFMLLLMWLAEFPLARFAADGSPSASSNPLIDYHVIYAIALVVAAVTYAGNTWGLGRWWAAHPFVQHRQWLR